MLKFRNRFAQLNDHVLEFRETVGLEPDFMVIGMELCRDTSRAYSPSSRSGSSW